MDADPLRNISLNFALRLHKKQSFTSVDELLGSAAKIAEFLKEEQEPDKQIGFVAAVSTPSSRADDVRAR